VLRSSEIGHAATSRVPPSLDRIWHGISDVGVHIVEHVANKAGPRFIANPVRASLRGTRGDEAGSPSLQP
jgi:hypothetical protein